MAGKVQLPVGIKPRGPSYWVFVKVAGKVYSDTFPPETPIPVMMKWREDQRAQHSHGPAPVGGSFAADIVAYLANPKIAAQAYARQKAGHLAAWAAALGSQRRRASFTQDEIEAVIQSWLKTLSPVTVYHRRATLVNLYGTLDARTPEQIHAGIPEAPNPVIRTTCPAQWTPRIDRAVSFEHAKRVHDAMYAERTPGKGIRQPSIAKLVVGIVLHTGQRAADLKRVTRSAIDWKNAIVYWPATLKGRRGKPISGAAATNPIPLTADGLAAFRAFDAANAYGQFSPAAVSHAFKRTARRVFGPDTSIHLYALRHSVGTEAYRVTGDLATVGRLLGHADGSRVTTQYAVGAHDDVNRAALAKLAAARAATTPRRPARKAVKARRARGRTAA
jgi:integrase